MYIYHARKWIDFWFKHWISDTFSLVRRFPHLATSWIAKSALLEPTLLKTNWETILSFLFRLILQGLRQFLVRVIVFDWTAILLKIRRAINKYVFLQQKNQVPKIEVLTYISCMDTAYVMETPPPR